MKAFAVAAAVFGLIVLMTIAASRPPAAVEPAAGFDGFSALRAAATLRRVLPPGAHPVGSETNRILRDQIVEEMRSLGFEVTIQSDFVCGGNNVCAPVENIVAVPKPFANDRIILLTGHYDSVPAGEGASDDGLGIATALECARVLSRGSKADRVAYLFTDGEEAGLLGAQAFVEHNPLARKVAAVVNMEARGTSGRALMFQTSGPSSRFVIPMARSVERPATSSLFHAVYERLPNDTDLSVFKSAGIAGMDFAAIGSPLLYHTTLDDVASLSSPTLQHYGDTVLATVRSLSVGNSFPVERYVWFDFFSRVLVYWPEWVSLLLSAIALALAAILLVLERSRLRNIAAAGAALFAAVVICASVAAGAGWVLRASGAFRGVWSAHPLPAITFFWVLPFVIVFAVAVFAGHAFSGTDVMLANATFFAIVGAVASIAFVGASYLFLVPAISTGLAAAVMRASVTRWLAVATIALCILFSVPVLLAPAWSFYDAMGLTLMPVTSVLVTLSAVICAPMVLAERRRLHVTACALAAIVAGIALITAALLPPFSRELPQHANIVYVEDPAGAHWQTDASIVGQPLRREVNWRRNEELDAFEAPAPQLHLAAPSFQILRDAVSGDTREVVARVSSTRRAPLLLLRIPDGQRVLSFAVDGVEANSRLRHRRARAGATRLAIYTVPGRAYEVRVRLKGTEPTEATVEDLSFALPPDARRLVSARNALPAVPVQWGDVTRVRAPIRF